MGLIRGALNLATFGAVASRSKKQRTAAMTLAATQGKSEEEVRIAGGRSFDAVNRADARAATARAATQGSSVLGVNAWLNPSVYDKRGITNPSDAPEARLRKMMAYHGRTPEQIDQGVAIWKKNVEEIECGSGEGRHRPSDP
jgi:hypothetical protein